jgi:CRISPR-associated protein Cas5d
MFERRAEKGQCFNQPYLGCREFTCSFHLVTASDKIEEPINDSISLGWMHYDMDYSNLVDPTPLFFNATMKQGVVEIPRWNSAEIRG